MKKNFIFFLFLTLALNLAFFLDIKSSTENEICHNQIVPFTLDNGLTVLVCPKKDAATVAVQMWYNVGSKHEKDGQRGIAHLIEHMIFKGTSMLSESDINAVVTKLSGYCNACTSYDYTGYLFDIPVANWDKVLPVMADCMQNCSFKQEHLNSEMKAVIAELKMNRDNYTRSLWFEMITTIFESHPYHFPVIGYKQDLWSVDRNILEQFYKKYYTPDNAVMVVVGDVQADDVYQKIIQNFACIPAGNGWNNEQFYVNEDVKTKKICLYRNVTQPICSISYVIPGFTSKNSFELAVLSAALTKGKSSRLYQLLVEDLKLVTYIHAYTIDLFEHSLYWIDFTPESEQDIDLIYQHIQKEIDKIAEYGLTQQEVMKAQKKVQLSWQRMLENSSNTAYEIGKTFLATKDPNFVLQYGKNVSTVQLIEYIKNLTATYCTHVHAHQGIVVPIETKYQKILSDLQEKSDQEDIAFLGLKSRQSALEKPCYAQSVTLNQERSFVPVDFKTVEFDNGLQVTYLNNADVDFITITMNFKVDGQYDPQHLQGLTHLVSSLLLEGTKNYPGHLFSDELDKYGISCTVYCGSIHLVCLPQDIEKALSLLREMVTQVDFKEQSLEKIKQQIYADLKKYWDTPTSFYIKIARDVVYKSHPYNRIALGTLEGIHEITLQDCQKFYQTMMTPQQAECVVVGNLNGINLEKLVADFFQDWQGQSVEDLIYPNLVAVEKKEVTCFANRDQVLLAFVGLSIDRMHEDYDKILLFDQIFSGSVISSMSSRLFKLRQESGLFYTATGSLLAGADKQPGMILIKTLVSVDKVDEAQKAFTHLIDTAIDTIEQEELEQAKRAIFHSFSLLFETNQKKAATLSFLRKYNLSADYFEKRIERLKTITVEQVQQAVKKILSSDKMAVIKIGRI